MPIDFSKLPDRSAQADPSDPNRRLDFSKLPDQQPAPASGAPAPHEEGQPSGFRKLLGMGTRVGSSILSAEGGFMGAGISGGGEALAQAIEGSKPDLTSIGTEAAFGAIPFGSVVKEGKTALEIAKSGLRSGALGTAHTAVSDLAHGHLPKFGDLATSFGLGATMGAGGSAWSGRAKPTNYEVVPTTQTGEGTSSTSFKSNGKVDERGISKAPEPIPGSRTYGVAPHTDIEIPSSTSPYGHGDSPDARPLADNELLPKDQTRQIVRDQKNLERVQKWSDNKAKAKESQSVAPEAPTPTGPLADAQLAPKDQTRQIQRDDKNLADVKKWLEGKRAVQDAKTQAIDAGGEVQPPTYSETVSSDIPGGKASSTTRITPPPPAPKEPKGPKTPSDLMDLFMQKESAKQKQGFDWPEAGGRMEPDPITGSHTLVPPVEPDIAPSAVVGDTGDIHPIAEPPVAPAEAPATVEPQTPPQQVATSPAHQYALDHYPDEVNAELDKLGEAYRGGDKSAGKKMAELRDFMSGNKMRESWKGVPDVGVTPPPAVEAAPPVEGSIRDQVESRANEGIQPTNAPPPNTGEDRILPSQQREMTPEEVQKEQSWIDRLKGEGSGPSHRDPSGEAGRINPKLLRAGTTLTGAAVGAPIGSYLDEENPGEGALKGGMAGAALGYGVGAGGEGLKNLTNFRNAELLAGPAQLKKPLSDLGAYIGLMAEKAAGGDVQTSANLLKEMLRVPTNTKNYLTGLKDPQRAAQAIGINPEEFNSKGLLSYVARPFSAAQNATQGAMERAGVPREEAVRTLMVGEPRMPFFKNLLKLQNTEGIGGQMYRFVHPFARIGTNIGERGIERLPGASFFNGDPNTKVARSVIGGGAMGLGALVGQGDANSADEGNPTSPMIKGLRRAAMASYGLPFAAGEAITAPGGPKEVYDLIPGISEVLPSPGPKESWGSVVPKFLKKNIFDKMLPAFLNPDTGAAR